jgi:hypothetical protein
LPNEKVVPRAGVGRRAESFDAACWDSLRLRLGGSGGLDAGSTDLAFIPTFRICKLQKMQVHHSHNYHGETRFGQVMVTRESAVADAVATLVRFFNPY